MSIVVEREGEDDCRVDITAAVTVRDLAAAVHEQLALRLPAQAFMYAHMREELQDGDALLADVGIHGGDERILVHVSDEHAAREKLRSMFDGPGSPDISSEALQRHLSDAVAAGDTDTAHLVIVSNLLSPTVVEAQCCDAARDGIVHHVATLIDAGCSVNARDRFGQTAAMHAALHGREAVLEELLRRQCDVDVVGPHGNTCVTLAATGNHWSVVKRLVRHGCDVNAAHPVRGTCLTIAAAKNVWGVVEFLVETAVGIDLNAGSEYDTCVAIAARRGRWDIVELLVAHGAVDDTEQSVGLFWLVSAAQAGRWELIKCLVGKGADVNRRTHFEDSCLMIAAKTGNTDALEFLLAHGANILDVNLFGETCATLAAEAGEWAAVRLLIEREPQLIAARNHNKNTCLSIAARAGRLDVVEFLLARGGIADDTHERGMTCLALAAAHAHWDVVRYLLAYGGAGRSHATLAADKALCLATAARTGEIDVVRHLVGAERVSPAAQDMFGDTCLTVAAEHRRWDVVRFLIDHTLAGDAEAEAVEADAAPDASTARAAMMINTKNRNGNTSLALAAAAGELSAVEHLVAHGADVHTENIFGDSCLALAVEGRHWGVVQYLVVRCGCRIDATNRNGLAHSSVAAALRAPAAVIALLEGAAPTACDATATHEPAVAPPSPAHDEPRCTKSWGGRRRAGYTSPAL